MLPPQKSVLSASFLPPWTQLPASSETCPVRHPAPPDGSSHLRGPGVEVGVSQAAAGHVRWAVPCTGDDGRLLALTQQPWSQPPRVVAASRCKRNWSPRRRHRRPWSAVPQPHGPPSSCPTSARGRCRPSPRCPLKPAPRKSLRTPRPPSPLSPPARPSSASPTAPPEPAIHASPRSAGQGPHGARAPCSPRVRVGGHCPAPQDPAQRAGR